MRHYHTDRHWLYSGTLPPQPTDDTSQQLEDEGADWLVCVLGGALVGVLALAATWLHHVISYVSYGGAL